ncbi:MAG: glycosyltransferase family 9 protein [Candidatus Krumholzibacteriota bacterium]
MKVLIVRTDRLGDMVLSLPVFEDIKTARPDWEVQAMVAPGSVPLVENDPHIDSVWTWTGDETEQELADLEDRLRREAFDAVVILQYRLELARLMKRVGISKRFGPLSKGSSWFLLNRGSWQSRSRGRRHEMEHNLALARRLTGGWLNQFRSENRDFPEPRLHLTEGQKEIGQEFRRTEAQGAEKVVFVHPGSGGSALDWEPARFSAVANVLARRPGWRVFVTGSASDSATVAAVATYLNQGVDVLLDRFSLREFLGILSAGDLFIGPSTGPLHIAAAVGCATVGLFPPVVTMSPDRWGPRGRLSRALVPDVACPARRICLEEKCLLYNCMTRIFDDQVLETALEVVHRKETEDGMTAGSVAAPADSRSRLEE